MTQKWKVHGERMVKGQICYKSDRRITSQDGSVDVWGRHGGVLPLDLIWQILQPIRASRNQLHSHLGTSVGPCGVPPIVVSWWEYGMSLRPSVLPPLLCRSPLMSLSCAWHCESTLEFCCLLPSLSFRIRLLVQHGSSKRHFHQEVKCQYFKGRYGNSSWSRQMIS